MMNEQREEEPTTKTIPEMLHDIERLRKTYGSALDKKLAASRSCTYCLNDLNDAQRLLDEAIVNLRKASPVDSDWHTQRSLRGQ